MHDELDPIDEASPSVSSPFGRSRYGQKPEARSTLVAGRRLELAGITVIEENWAVGSARLAAVAAAEQAQVAVVYIAEGRQWGYCSTGSVLLERGALVVSSAAHPWAVRVIEPLRTFTFLFPDQDIAGLPRAVESPYAVITPEAPLGAVVSDFFEGLTRRLDALPEGSRGAALSMARDLISRYFLAQRTAALQSPGDQILKRLFEYIERRLHEPALSPEILARAEGISVRYLHQLFSRRGLRVAAWIRQRRLESCRLQIATSADSVTLTEIAMRCGFYDSAHFSRLFRRAFGISPSSYRRQCRSLPRAER